MHVLDYFQQIYIINLPHRDDRRQEMTEQLSAIGLSFKTPGVRLFEAVRPEAADGFPSIGARGCFLSHLGVLRDACARGFERILILEDDLNFVPDFVERMSDVKTALERVDWSLFYGGYALHTPSRTSEDGALVRAVPSDVIQNAHFVGFRGSAICDAVHFLETVLSRPPGHTEGGPMHVDGAYNWFRIKFASGATVLSASQLGYQRRSRTDIHALRWFDRVPGIREAVGRIRNLQNKVAP